MGWIGHRHDVDVELHTFGMGNRFECGIANTYETIEVLGVVGCDWFDSNGE